MTGSERPASPGITLAPMARQVYEAWLHRTVREYAEGHVAAGNWPAEGSVERAQSEFDRLLPEGLETRGQTLWSIEDATGQHVGILWVGPRPGVPESLWVWDIAIESEARGRGYGQAALEALHRWAREQGYRRVGLHVFGSNETARRLYERTGYAITDVMMEKSL
jgi:GNAT superfamily N-acetyltransferase